MQSGPLPSITVKPSRLFGKEPDRGRSHRYAREDHDHGLPDVTQATVDPFLTGKEDVAHKVTVISSSSTNQQYPSAKAVYDELATKEELENKVTSISALSTDAEYPSAKTVYDNVVRRGDLTSNYTEWDANGHQTMVGNARPWRDELTDALNIKMIGPGVSVNTSENTVEFASIAQAASDYCHLNIQLNHDKDISSSIYPHIHFFQEHNAAPNFLLQYRWQINGGTKATAWTSIVCNTLAYTYTSGAINQIAYAAAITPPVGSGLSDIVQFRICRDTDNDSTLFAGADPYTGAVGFTAFDVHFMLNSIGSDTEYTK